MNEIRFDALPLAAPLLEALAEKGYTHPSPIQAQAIPLVLNRQDVLACAQTGTGKTAAFALPILHGIIERPRNLTRHGVRCLVLTPTRELAVQVAESFGNYGKKVPFRIGLVYGGVSQGPQVRSLQKGLDVLVATPGRLLDLIQQGHIDLSSIEWFVLDEADRMLDMGFINDIRKIAAKIPKARQTLLFSATMAAEITSLANSLLTNPEEIRIAPEHTTAEKIDQRILFVRRENKQKLLLDLVGPRANDKKGELSLVFSRTKHGARKLAEQLNKSGIRADSIHGNKSQAARQRTLDQFREGRTPVLVATDVAARGIDVKNITLVVNFDLPMEADSYVHRIGRTARAGASGRAVSLCSDEDLDLLRSVERLIKQTVTVDEDHNHHDEATATKHRNGERSSNSSKKGRSGNAQGRRGNSSQRTRGSGGAPAYAGAKGPGRRAGGGSNFRRVNSGRGK